MATSPLLVQQLLQTHDDIQAVKSTMQTKLNSLIQTQPYYKYLEIEGEQHPYYGLVADTLVIESNFDSLVAAIKDWELGGLTVAEAMGLLHRNQKPPSPTIVALVAIPSVPTPVADCADLLLNSFQSIAVFRSRAAPAALKRDIKTRMGFADSSRHFEVPLVSITKQCKGAFEKVKTLSKSLLDVNIDNTSVRQQLDYKQTMVGLTATGNAPTANPNITYLLNL